MMTKFQDHPEEAMSEAMQRMTDTAAALEKNQATIDRWFWKALFAFNLVLGSSVFWLKVLLSY